MYGFFGLRNVLTAYGAVTGIILLVTIVFAPPVSGSDLVLKALPRAVSGAGILFALLGVPAIYGFVSSWPLIRTWVPRIAGNWEGELRSNWPAIEARLPGRDPASVTQIKPVPVRAVIRASLFSVTINLVSDNAYSRSQTLSVKVAKDTESGNVQLRYIYLNETKQPLDTDSSSHYGAACLDWNDEGGRQELEGLYWTNRNWTKGLNTAGTIRLRHVGQGSRDAGVLA